MNRFRRFCELAELARELDRELLARRVVISPHDMPLCPPRGFSRELRELLVSRRAVALELARELRAGDGVGADDCAGPS